jgi:hypothetical protein
LSYSTFIQEEIHPKISLFYNRIVRNSKFSNPSNSILANSCSSVGALHTWKNEVFQRLNASSTRTSVDQQNVRIL